jgi:mitochondrial FAD-linked sulfhydryl oxidase
MAAAVRRGVALSLCMATTVVHHHFSEGGGTSRCESSDESLIKSGENPFSCANTVCQSKADMLQFALQHSKSSLLSKNTNETSKTAVTVTSERKLECPVDREELGNHTWALLHTLSAYYPEEPSLQQQSYASVLVLALSKLYPCHICAADFEQFVAEHPPDTISRENFSLWICDLHNSVNKKLNKPLQSCSIETLDTRWRTGKPECFLVGEKVESEDGQLHN